MDLVHHVHRTSVQWDMDNLVGQKIQNTNTNNFILHRIKNNKTLATSYFSMVKMYNIIQQIYNKINLKHYTYYIDILDLPMLLTLF